MSELEQEALLATEGEEKAPTARHMGLRAFLREYGRYLISILLSVVLTVGLLLIPESFYAPLSGLGRLGQLGVYIGVLLVTLLSSATIFLPSPSLAAAWIAGGFLSPPLVGLAAGLGAALGELSGYLAGYGGSALASKSKHYEKVHSFIERYGMLAIFVFAVIPNPLFDMAGLAAGATRMRPWRFLLACFAGKTVRFAIIAYLKHWGVEFRFLS